MRSESVSKQLVPGLIALVCLCVPISGFANAPLSDLDTDQISQKTDEELTELTARWSELSAGERRTVLREVRNRMRASVNRSAQAKANYQKQLRSQGATGIVVQRRYGRKSDGSVVVQTRVIQKNAPSAGRVTFGFGFERRANRQPVEQPANTEVVTNKVGDGFAPEGSQTEQ